MNELNPLQKKTRIYLIVSFFILAIIFLIGLFWLASTPGQTVGLTLAFAAGFSMIVLPCKGQALTSEYGIMALPGVIIDGELFSAGGINKDKLIKKLKSLPK